LAENLDFEYTTGCRKGEIVLPREHDVVDCQSLKQVIAATILDVVKKNEHRSNTAFRPPLIGYARADDPLFQELKTAVSPQHLLPSDLLPEAKTVVAFFLPFTNKLVDENRDCPKVARSWAVAYIEANALINQCCEEISLALGNCGVSAAWQQATHNFDPDELCARWSHKHVAYICGLGSFGLHHMLITASGCAGRFGSFVIDRELEVSSRQDNKLCKFFHNGGCFNCVKKCPSGALTQDGLDNQKCYSYLLETDKLFTDLGLCDVCGKCAVWCPMAVIDSGSNG